MAQQLTEGITLFLRVYWSYYLRTSVRKHVIEFGGVIEVVGGGVFSLTHLTKLNYLQLALTNAPLHFKLYYN